MQSSVRRPCAAASVLFVAAALTLSPVVAEPAALFQGRVIDADALSPRPGATVYLVSAQGEQRFQSQPTGADGVFAVETDAPGSFHVLVNTQGGNYLLANSLKLQGGANSPVALSLRSGNFQIDEGFGDTGKGFPSWAKWVIGGAIGAVGIFGIAEISNSDDSAVTFGDDDENPATPF